MSLTIDLKNQLAAINAAISESEQQLINLSEHKLAIWESCENAAELDKLLTIAINHICDIETDLVELEKHKKDLESKIALLSKYL